MLTIAATIGVLGVALGALAKWVFVPLFRLSQKALDFFSDWNGEPARPGHDAEMGVMERLKSTEYKAGRAEWHAGNGSLIPLRALVEDLVTDVATLTANQSALQERYDEHERTATEEFHRRSTDIRGSND